MQKYMALHEAVKKQNLDIVKLLVDLGADIGKTDSVSHH